MCKEIVSNDGCVSVPSAHWTIKDNATSPRIHTDLTGTADFSASLNRAWRSAPRQSQPGSAGCVPTADSSETEGQSRYKRQLRASVDYLG
jgi:hypothetical protein